MFKFIALLPFVIASAIAGELLAEPLPQYTHEQNTATGEYGYSYSGGPSSKTEYRALDGTTTGAYSYIDAHGILQSVNYIADEFGFRVAGTNIPSEGAAPLDAPDVAEAKAQHFAEHSRATLAALGHQRRKRGIFAAAAAAALPIATSSQSHFQIHKSAHLIAQQPALAIAAAPLAIAPYHPYLLRKKRGIAAYTAPTFTTVIQHLPSATSSQSRFQIHKGAKIIQEFEQPIYAAAAAAAPIVEAKAALPLAAPAAYYEHLPLATSRQDRFQLHTGAKFIQEYKQPLYAAAPAAAAPIAAAAAAAAAAAPAYLPAAAPAYPAAAPAYPAAAPAYPSGAPAYPSGAPAYPSGEPAYPSGEPAYPSKDFLPGQAPQQAPASEAATSDDAISVESA